MATDRLNKAVAALVLTATLAACSAGRSEATISSGSFICRRATSEGALGSCA